MTDPAMAAHQLPSPRLARRARAMRAHARLAAILAGALAVTGCASAMPSPSARPGDRGAGRPADARSLAGRKALPVAFEANVGQADPAVRFMARGRSHVAFLTDDGAVLAWTGPAPGEPAGERAARAARLTLAGARPGLRAEGERALPGRVNHLVGSDPRAWRTDVATFGRVRYREVYPGIDLVWHGDGGQVEFDLIVAPGADPGVIRLRVDGAGALALDPHGRLVLGDGGAVLERPLVYQDGAAGRRAIGGRYVVRGDAEVAFEVGPHDASRALVIDPVVTFSSYLGGGGDETPAGIASDAAGNVYVSGSTTSLDYPTADALQSRIPGFRSCFVSKLDPTASVLLYSTYLGGSLDDRCLGMAVDGPGNVYLTGTASSANFPVTVNAAQTVSGGGGGDAFVARLGPAGNALLYSTFVGGSGNDIARGIATDGAGGVWISGTTISSDFPTRDAFQGSLRGVTDAFLTRLDTTESGPDSLVFSTYFGGTGADGGTLASGVLTADGGVAVDADGNAFVTGSTASVDLPLLAPLEEDGDRFQGVTDIFIAKFDPKGALRFSTYLGGEAGDVAFAVATDTLGNVYVAGKTESFDFPFFPPFSIGTAFVAKLGPAGPLISAFAFGLPPGFCPPFCPGDDAVQAMFVDVFGRAHVTGRTTSPDFPLVRPVQGPAGGSSDAFVAVIDASGFPVVEFSTYLGGSGGDAGAGIFADPFGIINVVGVTGSLDFPLARPLALDGLSEELRGATDAFLVRIGSETFVAASVLPIARSVQAPTAATFFATMLAVGTETAVGCGIRPVTPTPTTFLFQRTDPATNALVGQPNTLVNIQPGGSQTFLIAFTPDDAATDLEPTDVILNFSCVNTPPARLVAGVNQPTLVVSGTPVPDIVALAATASNDGILTLDTPTAPPQAGAGAFAVATVNLGVGGLITVSADDNGAGLGLTLLVCRTDPATSACVTQPQPSLEVQIDAGQTPTFAVSAFAERSVPFEPAKNRVFARFRDAGGVIRGATSVAVRTP
jgi:hypothetical protein